MAKASKSTQAKELQSLLQQYWGHAAFRPLQLEIIQHVLGGKSGLALLPTGGGKSLCYQLPALAIDGLTLVISPLIALMKDQVEALQAKGIAAAYINSQLTAEEIEQRLWAAQQGSYKLLYVAPERLQSHTFRAMAPSLPIKLLAVDEAHCISQWGYDFRPAYLNIKDFRSLVPEGTPILALTATATPRVRADILEQLHLPKAKLFEAPFQRPNLRYSVLYEDDRQAKLLNMLHKVPGTAIVYTRSRKNTEALAQGLRAAGITAEAYHAGLSPQARSFAQESWASGKVRVVVATNAFGMGIDKADVRQIIHWDLPPDLESYYQEAGRAGRDGKTSFVTILFSQKQLAMLHKQQEARFPEFEQVQAVYQAACNVLRIGKLEMPEAARPLNLSQLESQTKLRKPVLMSLLRLLQRADVLEVTSQYTKTARLRLRMSYDQLPGIYQQKPELEPLLKGLLRLYGGQIFTDFVELEPKRLEEATGLTPAAIDQGLARLQVYQWAHYERPGDSLLVRLLQPRTKLTKHRINWAGELQQAQLAEERLQSLLAYVTRTDVCRQQLIVRYFGQEAEPCGRCDVCSGRHKQADVQVKAADVQAALIGSPLSHKDLSQSLGMPPQSLLPVMQKLQAAERLTTDEQGRWVWLA